MCRRFRVSNDGPDYQRTWLWRQAFTTLRPDCTTEEQEFFQTQYRAVREKAKLLVSRISADLPDYTVHDISHLDALWETASLVAEGAVEVNPAEAFVLGVSFLLHDAGMSLAAYPNGISDLVETVAWKDAIAAHLLMTTEQGGQSFNKESPPEAAVRQIVPSVLRRLHAEQAERLAVQSWPAPDGQQLYLIEDSDVRNFYGPTIGQIAHSHWWPVHKVEIDLAGPLGALANRTHGRIDRIKLACLLRVADVLHLDSRRAPGFLRAITRPTGASKDHWMFQERLSRPFVELDAVVFTAGQPFVRADANAWWLAYDMLSVVDQELRDVDLVLQNRASPALRARRVKGAGSTEALSRTVKTHGWRPVDTRIRISDVPHIVEILGGKGLYGDDPRVALRELIQNAADAVQARRRLERRPDGWGGITVGLEKDDAGHRLFVEDNGVGMSELVLTGPLLDFGVSFWRSDMATEEFPGLMAAGMGATGKYGIGFFAVFMLGHNVRVCSRRFDRGKDTGRSLEFLGGLASRPILVNMADASLDGGTRVEVILENDPREAGGLLCIAGSSGKRTMTLADTVAAIAPNLDISLSVVQDGVPSRVTTPGDWLDIADHHLVRRLNPTRQVQGSPSRSASAPPMRSIVGTGDAVFGRAAIRPSSNMYSFEQDGVITVCGLRSNELRNVDGVLLGEPLTVSRDSARPLVPSDVLAAWATEQAQEACQCVWDEELQARSAEVILECGGDVNELKILRFGDRWLSSEEFVSELASRDELAVLFDGEVDYDDDKDDVHPREFRDDFIPSDEVASVLRHDGAILRDHGLSWPSGERAGYASRVSKVAQLVTQLIEDHWGVESLDGYCDYTVGQVNGVDIVREVEFFRRSVV